MWMMMLYVGHNVAADVDFCLIIQFVFRQPNTYHPREKKKNLHEKSELQLSILSSLLFKIHQS